MASNESENIVPKRRRTAVACVSCRMRKSRCDGGWPVCAMCKELEIECVYVQPKKNTIPTGGGSPSVSQDERLAAIENKLDRLLAAGISSDHHDSEHHHTHNASNTIVAEMEDGGNDDDETNDGPDGLASIADAQGKETTFFGPTSSISFLHTLSTASLSLFRNPHIHNEHHDHQPLATHTPRSTTSTSTKARTRRPNPLSLPPHQEVLDYLEAYFSKTAAIFPYIPGADVLATYKAGRSRGFRRSFLALLNAIFALTVHEANQFSQIDPPFNEYGLTQPETFYARAESLLATINSRTHNLETVQCLLLLAQYSQATPKSARVWSLCCNAMTTAMQLGLHTTSVLPNLSPLQKEIRLRTWWQCIIMDRVLSMTFGRPPLIPESHVVVPLPSSQDINKISTEVSGIGAQPASHPRVGPDIFFVEAIKLYNILGKLVDTAYGNNLSQTSHQPLSRTVPKVLAIEAQLQAWHRELPPTLQYNRSSSSSQGGVTTRKNSKTKHTTYQSSNLNPDAVPVSRLALVLELRYLNTRNLTYRAILCAYLRSLGSEDFQPPKDGVRIIPESPDESSFMTFLACQSLSTIQECASDVIDIVTKYKNEPRALGARWYSTYYVFHACLALYGVVLVLVGYRANLLYNLPALAADPDDVSNTVNKLRQGLEALEVISKGTTPETRVQQQALVSRMVNMSAKLAQRYAGKGKDNMNPRLQRSGDLSWEASGGAQLSPESAGTLVVGGPTQGALNPPLDGGYFDAQAFQQFLQSTVDMSADFSFWAPAADSWPGSGNGGGGGGTGTGNR